MKISINIYSLLCEAGFLCEAYEAGFEFVFPHNKDLPALHTGEVPSFLKLVLDIWKVTVCCYLILVQKNYWIFEVPNENKNIIFQLQFVIINSSLMFLNVQKEKENLGHWEVKPSLLDRYIYYPLKVIPYPCSQT